MINSYTIIHNNKPPTATGFAVVFPAVDPRLSFANIQDAYAAISDEVTRKYLDHGETPKETLSPVNHPERLPEILNGTELFGFEHASTVVETAPLLTEILYSVAHVYTVYPSGG